ncbi:MAG TPA: hypothetical protein VFP12_15910 [Allosphingosinicella sp.]|nr:hypothetical protein [Allosphingosinicella sp.]
MDCRTRCIWEATLFGAFGGLIVFIALAAIVCALAGVAGIIVAAPAEIAVAVAAPPALGAAIGAAALIGCLEAMVGTAIFLAVVAIIVGVLAGLAYYSDCAAACGGANVAAGATGETTRAIGATVGDLTCAGASKAVDELEGQLAAARAARDAQRERVAQTRRRLLRARRVQAAAVAALAVTAFWNLIALAAAALAVAAATAAIARRRAQLREREAALVPLVAAVAALEGALAVARAVAEKACRDSRRGGGIEPRPTVELPGGFGTALGQTE